MMPTQAVRTYLEMHDPADLEGALAPAGDIRIDREAAAPPALFRHLYTEVGREYHWVDRLPWTDEDITRYLPDPPVELLALRVTGATPGYVELRQHYDG